MAFKQRIIKESELGDYLKDLRQKKKISLEKCAAETGVSLKYLKALENGRWEELPGSVYAKNFLKIYLNFLGGEVERGLDLWASVKINSRAVKKTKKGVPRVIFSPRSIKLALLVLVVLSLLGYFYYEASFLSAAPKLEIFYPLDNEQTSASVITVDGRVGAEAKVYINQEEIFVSPDGAFKEIVDLQKGLNNITIQAVNKKGKTASVEKKVLVQ